MDLLEELLAAGPSRDDLELDDTDLEWLEELQPPNVIRQPGRLHLICGDSIARDAPIVSRADPDDILSLAEGGQTWRRLLDSASEHVRTWMAAASEHRMDVGNAAIWLTGNDVYPRRAAVPVSRNLRELCEALADAITGTVSALHVVAETVMVLGPLPRRVDVGKPWEQTPAYHLERRVLRCIADMDGVCLLPLGRRFCTRKRSRHVVQDDFFRGDGVHLSGNGYARLLPDFPAWLV